MDPTGVVRDAYSHLSQQYIEMVDGPAGRQAHEGDEGLIRRHLGGLAGPVLDLGCGPGHWSAYLHAQGVEVSGVDVPEHSSSGLLSWYSTIHLPPDDLARALAGFRRLLREDGFLVIGWFDSDDEVASCDHAVTTAHRWPFEVFNGHLADAGFTEIERLRFQVAARPDRKYAAIAARAT